MPSVDPSRGREAVAWSPDVVDLDTATRLEYRPVLDVARGVIAGYEVVADHDGQDPSRVAATISAVLDALDSLPPNTFVAISVDSDLMIEPDVAAALAVPRDLGGIILDLSEPRPGTEDTIALALTAARTAGALIGLAGRDGYQPSLRSITRLRPALIRLGRAWVEGLEVSAAKRTAMTLTGQLAGQLDAWILVEGVETPFELRALSELGVPLATGGLVGDPRDAWVEVSPAARSALPRAADLPEVKDVSTTLLAVAQSSHTISDGTSGDTLDDTGRPECVVVLDEDDRPAAIVVRTAEGGWSRGPAFVVNVSTRIEDAALRAMSRPRDHRFDALVCIDDAGKFVGVAPIERLVRHLVTR